MKHSTLLILLCLFLFVETYAQKEIAINEELKNNSTKWKAEIKKNKNFKFLKGKVDITLYQFGPYKIFQQEIDTTEFDTRERGFKLPPIFRETTFSIANKYYHILVSDGTDTANIIFCRWLKYVDEQKGIIDFGTEPRSYGYIDSVTAYIKINDDTATWKFASTLAPFYNYKIEATYKYFNGIFPVECIELFEGSSRPSPFGSRSKGAAIKNSNDEYIAAVQLDGKKYVWLKKGLSPELNIAMASCLILILCNLEF